MSWIEPQKGDTGKMKLFPIMILLLLYKCHVLSHFELH